MILMVIFCTIMRSGVLRAATHQVRCIPDATRILVLSALLTMLGVFTLAGCYLSTTINQATAKDVNNRTFTFTSGAVFNPALANVSTGLAFSNNAQNFALCSGSQTATGTNKFGSCTLTVTNSSYSTGPQKNDVIKLDPCDFDSDFNTLTVSHGGSTVTSAAATTTAGTGCSSTTPATPSEVNNLRFTFPNGGVFDPALLNVSTSLAFSNSATQFTLTSAGGMATGTSSVGGGSCSLTVTTSTYSAGPQKNATIALNPCTFNSTDSTLIVTNLGITETSASGTPQ